MIPIVVLELLLRYVVAFPLIFNDNDLKQIRPQTLLHQPSEIPGLDFELAPNRESAAFGPTAHTNQYGRRDIEHSLEVPEGVYRIAILGDSYTFGWGVSDEETYPAQLERLLNGGAGNGARFEVLNFGVAGYSIHDEALLLEHRVLDWRPNVVVIAYFLNDPEIVPIQPLNVYFHHSPWWEQLRVVQLLNRAKFFWELRTMANGDYFRYLHMETRKPWRQTLRSMEKIRTLTRNRSVDLIFLILPEPPPSETWANYSYRGIHRQVAGAAAARGIAVVDTLEGFSEFKPISLRVSESDGHLSVLGNSILARMLAARLKQRPAR